MTQTQNLLDNIIKGIQEKKGKRITIADLTHLSGCITKYLVICQGNTPTQVEAIAESIGELVLKETKEKPIGTTGENLCHWVVMDYADIMVHIFVPEQRSFYDLESLWIDAQITVLEDID